MNVLPIVTEFPGFIRCTIAGPSSTAASLRGRVGGPGGASAPKSGSMSAFVPWNICPLRDSDGGLRRLSCANTLLSISRPELAASRSCITFDHSSFKLVTSDLFPVDFWDVPKSFSLFLRIGAVHGIFLSLGGSMCVAQKSSYCWAQIQLVKRETDLVYVSGACDM